MTTIIQPTRRAEAIRGCGVRNLYVSAGEASGDLHCASVVAALVGEDSSLHVEGVGGRAMADAGVQLTAAVDSLSTMGFSAVGAIPRHLKILSEARRKFRTGRVDLALLVDYPGLHLRVAREASAAGVPALYYIAPQMWAWGLSRAKLLRDTVSHLAAILPFEESFFRQLGIPTTFVGHPLLDLPRPSRAAARIQLGLSAGASAVGLFPGSRAAEVRRMWPILREAAREVRRSVPDLEVLVAAMPGLEYSGAEEFRMVPSNSAAVMAAADAALCKSGTSTLEAALADTPMIILYRTDALSYLVARRVVRCTHVGLVNLVAGRSVVPELIQGAATSHRLAESILPLLEADGRAALGQRAAFQEVRRRLGTPGAAGRVANLCSELMAT